jgi:hypothetical protein
MVQSPFLYLKACYYGPEVSTHVLELKCDFFISYAENWPLFFFKLVHSADRYFQSNANSTIEIAKSSFMKFRILQLLDYYRQK